jgi:hypothetical protein
MLKGKPGLVPGFLLLGDGRQMKLAGEIIRRLQRLTPSGPSSRCDDVLSPSVVALRAPFAGPELNWGVRTKSAGRPISKKTPL